MAPPVDGVYYLQKTLEQLLKDGDYSDLTVHCTNRTFKIHQALVCKQDAYFANAVSYKIKQGQPPHDIHVHLEEEDERAVEGLLSFLYTGDCAIRGESEEERMTIQCGVYNLAEEHELLILSDLAEYNIKYMLWEWVGSKINPSRPDFTNIPLALATILRIAYASATKEEDALVAKAFEILLNTPQLFDTKEIREALQIITRSTPSGLLVHKRDIRGFQYLMEVFETESQQMGEANLRFRYGVIYEWLKTLRYFPRGIWFRGVMFGDPFDM